jgi:hypothetical protein
MKNRVIFNSQKVVWNTLNCLKQNLQKNGYLKRLKFIFVVNKLRTYVFAPIFLDLETELLNTDG